jgi:hypothetical protein
MSIDKNVSCVASGCLLPPAVLRPTRLNCWSILFAYESCVCICPAPLIWTGCGHGSTRMVGEWTTLARMHHRHPLWRHCCVYVALASPAYVDIYGYARCLYVSSRRLPRKIKCTVMCSNVVLYHLSIYNVIHVIKAHHDIVDNKEKKLETLTKPLKNKSSRSTR